MGILSSRSDTMKKVFLYASLFIMAFFIGYLYMHEKYKDYHYDYEYVDNTDNSYVLKVESSKDNN